MAYQSVFKRREIKYLLSRQQQQLLLQAMEPFMQPDPYGRTTIRNLYYDTADYRLIRHSLEKPVYKEKLRVRSYRQVTAQDTVFVELKKKYKGVVYKRRICLSSEQAMDWLAEKTAAPEDSQIAREISYFCRYYGPLRPMVYLSYDREAYFSRGGDSLRITFDDNICFRQEQLSLEAPAGGKALLQPEQVLMEIKTSGSIPLWLTRELTRLRIYKTSFSKYGTAYLRHIRVELKGDQLYA